MADPDSDRTPLLFRSKYALFEAAHRRTTAAPRPEDAELRFAARLRHASYANRLQLMLLTGFYFSVVTTLASVAPWSSAWLSASIDWLAETAATLSTVFLLGILACRRFLALAEVELYFLSAEARRPGATPDRDLTAS